MRHGHADKAQKLSETLRRRTHVPSVVRALNMFVSHCTDHEAISVVCSSPAALSECQQQDVVN